MDPFNRLSKHFTQAQTCTPEERKIGLEVESLFMGRAGFPISYSQSQTMLGALAMPEHGGWELKNYQDTIVEAVQDNWHFFYELGHNNIELATPAVPIAETLRLLKETKQRLEQLYNAGSGTCMFWEDACDHHPTVDTLIMPDERDKIWKKLDGPALVVLAHIASVHINIDLTSLEEGFEFIRRLNSYYRERAWPPKNVLAIWRDYILGSHADYEHDRYGPPPETFADYIDTMIDYRVMMNRKNNELFRMEPVRPYCEMDEVDQELFLRSIWWWTRLRVREGKLVLEIRAVPRGDDRQLAENVLQVLTLLNIIP